MIKLGEITSEIKFETETAESLNKELVQEDAEEFINDHVQELVDEKSLTEIFSSGEQFDCSYDEVEPYWNAANELYKKLFQFVEGNEDFEVNSDDIPVQLALDFNDFEYRISKSIISELLQRRESDFGPSFLPHIPTSISAVSTLSYQKKVEKINNAESHIKWLELQQTNLKTRQKSLSQPKGTVLGLGVFVVFSIIGIIVPLCLMPVAQVTSLAEVVLIKWIDIGLFALGLGAIIWYFVFLIKSFKR